MQQTTKALICAFVVRIWHKTHFLMARLKCFLDKKYSGEAINKLKSSGGFREASVSAFVPIVTD